MGSTPLYDALRAFAAQRPLRMHMPGHKGKSLPAPELAAIAAIDFTELPPTGDLFSGGGAIGAAEALWAKVFHMASCLFLTGGSTQGVHAALALACKPGETVLLDRGSHRSAYNALALLDLKPVYLERPWLASEGITGPISPSSVAQALEHRRGGVLVVDGAHGAHLPFLGNDHLSAADLVVTSAHKTLPALGQSALLLAGERFPHAGLRRAASLYGSSSPSYPMMACLDLCRAWMEEEGAAAYRAAARQVAALRRDYPSLPGWCSAPPTALPPRRPWRGWGCGPRWPTRAMWCSSPPAPTRRRTLPASGPPWMPWPGGTALPCPRLRPRRRRFSPPVRPSFPPGFPSPCPPRRDASAPSRWPPIPPGYLFSRLGSEFAKKLSLI